MPNLTQGDFSNIIRTSKSLFYDCPNLHYAYFPNVETVELETFYGVTNINILKFGPNLTSIGHYAFWGSGLTTIIFEGTTPPEYQQLPNTGTKFKYNNSGLSVYVPDAAVNDYKNATGWADSADIVYPISQYNAN